MKMTMMKISQLRLIEKGTGGDLLVLRTLCWLFFGHSELLFQSRHIPSCMGCVYHGVSLWPFFRGIFLPFLWSLGRFCCLIFEGHFARFGV